jgi:EAL domain-containing protein (putative c-di-GMP-specific phosphodiesterase class I)
MIAKRKLLIIDDDLDAGQYVTAAAEAKGWECVATTTAPDFLNNLTTDTTLIFLDLRMPELDGVELLRILAQQRCQAGIILMSGVGKSVLETADEMARAQGLYIVGQLQKPFQLAALEALLEQEHRSERRKANAPIRIIPFLDDELRDAIQRKEFLLHYQPQIDLATGEVVAVEALVRWIHTRRGLIHPEHFIARLELLGLIDQLGWIVAKNALADIAMFADEHGNTTMLSLNVSARSLHDLKFPDDLETLARSFGVPADQITLEITESGLISELARTLDVLTRLRMKTMRLSIDDFGTGYSMMRQLRHIPANELKIDRSFVQKMHLTYGDRVMVQKTIEIGHDLGMKVVAEGVETVEQLEFLRSSGCDLVQGFLFTRPLAAADLVRWLKDYRASLPYATTQNPMVADDLNPTP